nr:MAG TPA: hypothetical protein [Caudoviricetes sp.]
MCSNRIDISFKKSEYVYNKRKYTITKRRTL